MYRSSGEFFLLDIKKLHGKSRAVVVVVIMVVTIPFFMNPGGIAGCLMLIINCQQLLYARFQNSHLRKLIPVFQLPKARRLTFSEH